MEQRERSPAANIRRSPSPAPHGHFTTHANAIGSDPSLLGDSGPTSDPFNDHTTSDHGAFDVNQTFFNPGQQQYTQPPEVSSRTAAAFQNSYHQQNQFSSNLLDPNGSLGDFPNLDNQYFDGTEQNQAPDIDPSLFLNASVLDSQQEDLSTDQSNMFNTSTLQQQPADAPHLLQQDGRYGSLGGAHQGGYASQPHHDSLDPISAAYPQAQNEWSAVQFRAHRRAPSDALSEVSSSAQPSPFQENGETFDPDQHSPLLNPQQDPILYSSLGGLEQFTLSDNQGQHSHISPSHSPRMSPNLAAQQPLPHFTSNDGFGLLNANGQQGGAPYQETFPSISQGQENFPQFQSQDDMLQSDHMSPPEINVEFAPPSRQQSFEPKKIQDDGAGLIPPERNRSRNRHRTTSEPYATPSSSRSASPAGRAIPALHPEDSLSPRSQGRAGSRSPSPSGITKNTNRRASTSAIDNKAFFLDLLNKNQQSGPQDFTTPSAPLNSAASGADGSAQKRAQKHPANYQCTLCTKRFTRAYNLRSHLRTHTDERPFVCTVCGKAFARQHDRKRHEGLHSGEKKFVCRGPLSGGAGSWGCARRFARADALGRHFRSEAGRACIKPLLDDEARERAVAHQDQVNQSMLNPGQAGMQPPIMVSQPDFAGMALPAALLQQYPALADIQWNSLPQGPVDEGDYNGRSSFEAGSGGEYYEDDDGGYVSDAAMQSTYVGDDGWTAHGGQRAAATGYYSDYDGR